MITDSVPDQILNIIVSIKFERIVSNCTKIMYKVQKFVTVLVCAAHTFVEWKIFQISN